MCLLNNIYTLFCEKPQFRIKALALLFLLSNLLTNNTHCWKARQIQDRIRNYLFVFKHQQHEKSRSRGSYNYSINYSVWIGLHTKTPSPFQYLLQGTVVGIRKSHTDKIKKLVDDAMTAVDPPLPPESVTGETAVTDEKVCVKYITIPYSNI